MNENEYTSTVPLAETPAPPLAQRPGRISRRNLIIGAGAVGVGAAAITSGILFARNGGFHGANSSGPIGTQAQIAHLLRRAGFGANADEIAMYQKMGVQGAIDHLIDYASVADDIDTKVAALNLDPALVPDIQRGWLVRMLYTKRPLQEKMVLFWHGLLTSSFRKVGGKQNYAYLTNQNNYFRAHALDTYDTILLAMTSDPAMMWWLDLRLSTKNAPNENYARELMELFTLGVSGGYTQQDVHEAARALTGWQLKAGNAEGTYNEAQHDGGSKTLLGQTGNLDYKDVIRIVANHPATGPYLCKRLFSFFVHENPSDADVAPMVKAYYNSKHSIAAVIRAMFNSPAFFSAAAYRARIKSPVEFVVGTIRQLGIETDGQGLANALSAMGQELFAPPNVAGWPGDVDSSQWLNTATWLYRVNFVSAIFGLIKQDSHAGLAGTGFKDAATTAGLKTPEDVAKHFTTLFVDTPFSTERTSVLTGALTAKTGGAPLNLPGNQTVDQNSAREMLYLLLTSPDYQLN